MQTDTQIEEKIEMVFRYSLDTILTNKFIRNLYVKLCEITLGEIGTRGRIKKHSLLSYNVPFSFLFPSSNVKAIKIRERNPAQEVAAGLARKHACDLTPRHDTSWSRASKETSG